MNRMEHPESPQYAMSDHSAWVLWRKLCFRVRERVDALLLRPLRTLWWSLQGMKIGKETSFSVLHVTWPHQVRIGNRCRIEHDVYFHFDGICKSGARILIGDDCFIGAGCEFNIVERIELGNHCLIAAGSRFIDHNHGIALGEHIGSQPCSAAPISIGEHVWVGANAVILAGVEIGNGSVVGAGSVVTHSVPSNAIVAGVPARMIQFRS
jgi:acetyltransferase-like isoleucine patch superfamily enzyme